MTVLCIFNIANAYSGELFSVNFIIFVASRFKANLLVVKPYLFEVELCMMLNRNHKSCFNR